MEVIEMLEELFPYHGYDQHIYGVQKRLKELKIVSWVLGLVYFGFGFNFLIFPFEWQLKCWIASESCEFQPIVAHWYPFDVLSPIPFVLTFLWYAWFLFVAFVMLLSSDLLYTGLLMILSMEFDILAADIEEVQEESELITQIAIHQQLINISGKLEKIFSPMLLVNIMLVIFGMCFTAFLTVAKMSPIFIWKFGGPCLVYSVNGFILCSFPQKLTDSSSSVAYGTYCISWYEMKPKFRKLMLIVMMMAQNGQVLTGRGFFEVSMGTFYWMLDSAYSYLSCLMGLYKP